MQEILSKKKKDILKEDDRKTFKKLTLFFLLNPVPFNVQDMKNKRGLDLNKNQSRQVTKQVQ